jgi:cell division septum initiation protein DivIVA
MSITVPVEYASVIKNSDGTYSVQVTHGQGNVTDVNFPHIPFAQAMADSYAAFLNGFYKLESLIPEIAPNVEKDTEDVAAKIKADADKVVTAAKTAAAQVKADAEVEVQKIMTDAKTVAASIKLEAEKLLADAKAEATKLLEDAKAEIAKLTAVNNKPAVTKPATPVPPKPTVAEEIEDL